MLHQSGDGLRRGARGPRLLQLPENPEPQCRWKLFHFAWCRRIGSAACRYCTRTTAVLCGTSFGQEKKLRSTAPCLVCGAQISVPGRSDTHTFLASLELDFYVVPLVAQHLGRTFLPSFFLSSCTALRRRRRPRQQEPTAGRRKRQKLGRRRRNRHSKRSPNVFFSGCRRGVGVGKRLSPRRPLDVDMGFGFGAAPAGSPWLFCAY